MKELSDKTHIVILTGDIRIWLNKAEFEKLISILETGKIFLNINGRIFNAKNIIYAGSRIEVDLADKIKKGEWRCEYGYWHSRNQECGHGLI